MFFAAPREHARLAFETSTQRSRLQHGDTFMANIRKEHEGHAIDIKERKGRPSELIIDGKPLRYRQLPDGRYFLDEYAYDWTDDLVDLARRYLDYKARIKAGAGSHGTKGRK
jgi:hypothetical protein